MLHLPLPQTALVSPPLGAAHIGGKGVGRARSARARNGLPRKSLAESLQTWEEGKGNPSLFILSLILLAMASNLNEFQ